MGECGLLREVIVIVAIICTLMVVFNLKWAENDKLNRGLMRLGNEYRLNQLHERKFYVKIWRWLKR